MMEQPSIDFGKYVDWRRTLGRPADEDYFCWRWSLQQFPRDRFEEQVLYDTDTHDESDEELGGLSTVPDEGNALSCNSMNVAKNLRLSRDPEVTHAEPSIVQLPHRKSLDGNGVLRYRHKPKGV